MMKQLFFLVDMFGAEIVKRKKNKNGLDYAHVCVLENRFLTA